MVVLADHIVRVSALEAERNSVLVVDPDAITSRLFSSQCFKPVAWRRPEITQDVRRVQHVELPLDHRPQAPRQPSRMATVAAVEEILRRRVAKRLNHLLSLRDYTGSIKPLFSCDSARDVDPSPAGDQGHSRVAAGRRDVTNRERHGTIAGSDDIH